MKSGKEIKIKVNTCLMLKYVNIFSNIITMWFVLSNTVFALVALHENTWK